MKQAVLKVVNALDLSKHIANHISGQNHSPLHRKAVGFTIMAFGVTMVKLAFIISHALVWEVFIDIIGYGLHAIGLGPFITKYENH